MIETMTAEKVHERIEVEARTKAVPEVRFVESIQVGQVVRQGDVYCHCVSANHPRGKDLATRQLAIGDTQGSRHIAEAPALCFAGTKAPEWCTNNVFLGPLVEAKERFVVTHPEHAHLSLPPGCYQVTHQLDARTLQRVQD